jgi:hypothetical protein
VAKSCKHGAHGDSSACALCIEEGAREFMHRAYRSIDDRIHSSIKNFYEDIKSQVSDLIQICEHSNKQVNELLQKNEFLTRRAAAWKKLAKEMRADEIRTVVDKAGWREKVVYSRIADEINDLRSKQRPCPCELTQPCHEACTCANPFMSAGCRRCCKYGSAEQQKARAERLADAIDNYGVSEFEEADLRYKIAKAYLEACKTYGAGEPIMTMAQLGVDSAKAELDRLSKKRWGVKE